MNRERMKELADSQFEERQTATTIVKTDEPNRLNINGRGYELIKNYREAFDEQMLAARFSEFLEKYDYIVGDIASNQLRLRGFYAQGVPGIPRNQQINALQDYLYEEINFGAPYFVLQNLEPHLVDEQDEDTKPKKSRRRHRNHGKKDTGRAEVAEKKVTQSKPKRAKQTEVKVKGGQQNRRFQLRERPNTTADEFKS